MKYKLIAMDLDGTLNNDQKVITEKTKAALMAAQKAGIRLALASARPSPGLFKERDILRLHEIMMSLAGYEYGGQYKTDDNVILEVDADGNRRVRFRPTPASETKQAMEQLELAYMEAKSDAAINQLLLIPCVILDFLCIFTFFRIFSMMHSCSSSIVISS